LFLISDGVMAGFSEDGRRQLLPACAGRLPHTKELVAQKAAREMAHSVAPGQRHFVRILSDARTFCRPNTARDYPLDQKISRGKWKIWDRISRG